MISNHHHRDPDSKGKFELSIILIEKNYKKYLNENHKSKFDSGKSFECKQKIIFQYIDHV